MAKKQKPGFITIKSKDFPKYFNDKNLDKIWSFFEQHFNDVRGTKIDWEKEYYTTHIKGTSRIPLYPETDRWDDSEGIQPKQLFKIIDFLGFENFKILASILSKNVGYFIAQDTEDTSYFYTEGETRETTIISWKEVIRDFIMPKIKKKDTIYFGKLFFCDALGLTNMATTFTKNNFPYSINNDIFKSIIEDEMEVEKILFFKTNQLYDLSEELSLDKLNADDFFQIREDAWKEKHNIIPKNRELLLIDPEYWDRQVFLDSMQRLYKTKNLTSLNKEDQSDFISFYKAFGKLLSYVAPMLNNEKVSKPSPDWPSLYRNDIPEGLKKILANAGRGIDIKLKVSDILHIYATMTHFEDSNDFILKRNRITIDDVYQLNDVGQQLKSMTKEELESLSDIPWRHIGVFKKYNVHNTKAILELYTKTKDKKLSIPLVSGRVGQYNYEILPKNDIRGLVAGNATNCCQHIPSGIGRSCVYYGAESKDSSFFIITDRAGTIVCQSWIWVNKDVMVCDSAEAVRQDPNFYDAYVEMAREVVNRSKEIKEVRIGSRGRAFGNQLPSTTAVSIPTVPSGTKFNYGRSGTLYSDATNQYLLYKK